MKKKNLLSIMVLMFIVISCLLTVNIVSQNKTVISQVSKCDNGEILISDPNLDKIWKSSFKYAIIIPKEASIKSYTEVMEVLENGSIYNRNNTIVICPQQEETHAKEIAGSFTIFVSNIIKPQTLQKIDFYSAQKERQGSNNYLLKIIEN